MAKADLNNIQKKVKHIQRKSNFLNFDGYDCVQDVELDAMDLLLPGETKKC